MEDAIKSLPGWGLLIVVLAWMLVPKVLARINRVPTLPAPPSKPSHLPLASSPSMPAMKPPSAYTEAAMDRILEQDRQQTEMLRTIATTLGEVSEQMQAQGRASTEAFTRINGVLSEMHGQLRTQSIALETILRRSADDTGRFPHAR